MVTPEDIEKAKSPKGGFTKIALAKLGVPWPPPKGWKEALLAGKTMTDAGLPEREMSPIRPDITAHDLLRQVVVAVINAGHERDLWELPDVIAHFGGRVPPELLL